MTVTTEELKEWAASKQWLLDHRSYPHPTAYALGLATMSGDKCIEVKFLPSAVNVGKENELTLAILAHWIPGFKKLPKSGHVTINLNRQALESALGEYPLDILESATPVDHGNVWAMKVLLRVLRNTDGSSESLLGRTRVPILHLSYDLTDVPSDVPEVYLRLMAQSLCKTMPLDTSVVLPKTAFSMLTNVVWSLRGVFTLEEFDEAEGEALMMGLSGLPLTHQDKLPRMLDYVRPRGVRIVDGARVRLGARLADSTTVMPEGAANFNAVTLGECMVEGRISAGVTVGAGSDIGGGVSTLGTMSGGNDVRVSIGEYCLLEAECILGIPIGDRVRVRAGLDLIGSTPFRIVGSNDEWIGRQTNPAVAAALQAAGYAAKPVLKVRELAGINDAIFRRNSLTGSMEVVPRGNHAWGKLNDVLHKN
jgi:2,3,4,5-tetrahydropyridine-2-carboxylate N-succinyltransferase